MFKDHYIEWRNKRIETTLGVLGREFFKNKTVLEVGCGYADVSNYLVSHCNVGKAIAIDGRLEHLREIERRQSRNEMSSKIEILHRDFDKECNFYDIDNIDIIIHWGLLYHLKNPKKHLRDILKYTNCILLETEVDGESEEDTCITIEEPKNAYDQALNGIGSRPTQNFIENILRTNGFLFDRIDDKSLNCGNHVYDWTHKLSDRNSGYRRFWIAWKN